MITLTEDPVVSVNWSADGAWLACAVATGGGVRTQVWVVRPDGSEAASDRRLGRPARPAGPVDPQRAPGHGDHPRLRRRRVSTHCFLADPATGELHPMATGDLLDVLDMSVDEHLVILKDGQRGKQFCVVVDRLADQDHPLLPYPATGSTEVAIIRPAPPGDASSLIAYVCTDAGLPRNQLVAVPVGAQGRRGHSGVLAARDDAELEDLDADDAGRQLLLVWNVGGRSELELFDTVAGDRPDAAGSARQRRLGCSVEPGRSSGDLGGRGTGTAPGAVVPEHPDPDLDAGRRCVDASRAAPGVPRADQLSRP